ncbi:EpsI domain-containing exosortase [Hahella ganghwensis]|uniref:exosortase A n=1 Tax=Hahella ganghwensis TaxID=286420 RepID=UPI00035C707E|nr:EpsI domain-containing exosortase [Hahella ganghwensis]
MEALTTFIENIKSNKPLVLLIIILSLAWYLAFQTGIDTAAFIWLNNEIFNHCAFVIPFAIYLIYRKREDLVLTKPVPTYSVFTFLLLISLVYLFGKAGDINVLMHLAAFSFIPFAIFLCIGLRSALAIFYPLFFFVFAIPVGEQLIPTLQDIAAKWSVVLLNYSSVPVFRNGLYIDIPQGRFLVAEACSGISFTIVSVVIGSLLAHLNYTKLWKKSLFILISFLVPIAANILRVYGIIIIAFYSDMEYAVGADHLIYGWFFFSIVIFLLILMGEIGREPESAFKRQALMKKSQGIDYSANWNIETFKKPALLIGSLLAIQVAVANFWIDAERTESSSSIQLDFIQDTKVVNPKWHPVFEGATQTLHTRQPYQDENCDVYLAWYGTGSKGELVSYLNREFDIEKWSLIHQETISFGPNSVQGTLMMITSPEGEKRIILSWYQLADFQSSSKTLIKLRQTAELLFTGKQEGAFIALSVKADDNEYQNRQEQLISAAESLYPRLTETLPFTQ